MYSLAPIAVFAFNRPDHLRRTLAALAANDLASKSAVTVFCDGPRNTPEQNKTNAVQEIAFTTQGFASVEVIKRKQNMGCAASVIAGLKYMFAQHERLIVIEDDILTSPHTLRFLNNCLDKYESYPTVFNVAAWSPPRHLMPTDASYPYDAYFIPRFNGWGWATWKNRWEKIDWNVADYTAFAEKPALQHAFNAGGTDLSPMLADQMSKKLDTWDIRMDYSRFKQGCVGINPVISYTTNIGCDGTGTHYTGAADTRLNNDIQLALANPCLPDHVFLHKTIISAYQNVHNIPPLWKRAVNKAARLVIGHNILQ